MNQKKELIKNTIIISIGKFSTKIVSFLLLPLYTSLLSKTEYGSYDLLNTISIFLVLTITFQMEEAMFRFFIDAKDSNEKKNILSLTIVFVSISLIIWCILIFIVGTILKYPYTVWLIIYCVASTMYTIVSAFSRGEGRFKLYSFLAFFNSALNISLNVIFIAFLKMGLVGLFVAYTISGIISAILGFIKLKGYKYFSVKHLDKKLFKSMIKFSLPLVPNSMSWSIINLSNRLIISNKLGTEGNGIYAVSHKFPTIINTFYGFFNTSWRESASKALHNDDHDDFYVSVNINLKRFLLGVSYIMLAILPFVFSILVNDVYSDAYNYIPVMIISVYFANLSGFSSGIFSAYKDTKILAPTTIIAAIINIIISLLLIDDIGLFAPCIGSTIAYLIIYLYRDYRLKKYVTLKSDKMLIYHIIVMILLGFMYYSNSLLVHILGLLLGFGYTIFINKSFINGIYNNYIKRKKR